MKLLLLCDLYIKNKNELITEEKNEIIKYTRSRLPNFVSQLRRLLEQLKAIFSSMNSVQKREFATYLVPEV